MSWFCACRIITSSFVALITFSSLIGCASISSEVSSEQDKIRDGVPYYMPRNSVIVKVTLDANGNQTPSVAAGSMVPDYGKRFFLFYEQNYFGKNEMKITVNGNGLLSLSESTTTSGVKEIARNIAATIGTFAPLSITPGGPPAQPKKRPQCDASQTYTAFMNPEERKKIVSVCDYNFSITPQLTEEKLDSVKRNTPRIEENGSQAGIFFKQEIPYTVIALNIRNNTTNEYVASSPNESGIYFLPVSRTFFADNKTKITLSDGVLTDAEQTSDGELVGLTAIPANMMSAYFEAVGKVFSSLSGNVANETTLISNEKALATAKIKKQMCDAVIAATPLSGKTGDELTKAFQTIIAACT